jgi:UDP:flavonoid glycosyltransferase YjiC (YdhE family)
LRFLLATYGTRGDVHPMLALALALLRKGHGVVVAGPPEFAGDASRLTVDYRPMGGNLAEFLARNSSAVGGNVLRMARAVKHEIDTEVAAQFDMLTNLAKQSDHVVGASLAFAARSCAESAGRPYHFIAFAPETFPSRQVILPHVLDQFPWSARIAERGLGPRPLLKHRPSSGSLVVRIRQALEDSTLRERAAKLGHQLAGRDGASRVAAILTGELRG